jgi:hypothetical protein
MTPRCAPPPTRERSPCRAASERTPAGSATDRPLIETEQFRDAQLEPLPLGVGSPAEPVEQQQLIGEPQPQLFRAFLVYVLVGEEHVLDRGNVIGQRRVQDRTLGRVDGDRHRRLLRVDGAEGRARARITAFVAHRELFTADCARIIRVPRPVPRC